MTNSKRLEINIYRLMRRCEEMAKNDVTNWRLEKYTDALDEMIKKLQNEYSSANKSLESEIIEYVRRVEFLKGLIGTSKLSNPMERVVATQMLPTISSSVESTGPNITTQIHQKTAARYNQEIRSELFKTRAETQLRLRKNDPTSEDKDLDDLLKYNRNMQEKIAENMLSMTSTMKEHALTANAIIKKDVNYLEKSNRMSDTNQVKLKGESLKLEEHTKSNWTCGLLLMIVIVLAVFFNMILFIKISKKKV